MLITKKIHKKKMESLYVPIIPDSILGKLIISSLLIMFLAATSYKLTNASLWLDEAVEYLVSVAPFKDMLSYIKQTNQPPLYNFVMHFLLKFSNSEYWFRFTSVLFGTLGCIGLYASINEMCGWKMAGISIFVYSFLSTITYYNQECSEYSLLLCVLSWSVYFYICLLKHFSRDKLIWFTVFCILSMYSQYGAIFPLFGMQIALFLFYFLSGRKKETKDIVLIIGVAEIVFGLLLYFIFLRVQRGNNAESTVESFSSLFGELQNFIANINSNFSFFFPGHSNSKIVSTIIEVVYMFFVFIILWAMVQKKDKQSKYIAISSFTTYLLFFVMKRIGIYSNGAYSASRHSLSVFPILFVGISVSGYTLFQSVQPYIKKKSKVLAYANVLLILILLSVNNYINWQSIKNNWVKQNVRSSLNLWLDETGGTEELYLYYSAVPAFVFYAESKGLDYGKEILDKWGISGINITPSVTQYKNFHYGESMRGKDVEYVKSSIQESFSNRMPDNFWFIASHVHSDIQTYMDAFAEMGYDYDIYLWDNEGLLWFYNASYIEKDSQPVG